MSCDNLQAGWWGGDTWQAGPGQAAGSGQQTSCATAAKQHRQTRGTSSRARTDGPQVGQLEVASKDLQHIAARPAIRQVHAAIIGETAGQGYIRFRPQGGACSWAHLATTVACVPSARAVRIARRPRQLCSGTLLNLGLPRDAGCAGRHRSWLGAFHNHCGQTHKSAPGHKKSVRT